MKKVRNVFYDILGVNEYGPSRGAGGPCQQYAEK